MMQRQLSLNNGHAVESGSVCAAILRRVSLRSPGTFRATAVATADGRDAAELVCENE